MQMTIAEMSSHFGISKRTLQHLYYRRNDCPQPVGTKTRNWGGKRPPAFDVQQFEAYLQELGLIERQLDSDKMTLAEVRELLDVCPTHLRYLQRTDPKFPKTITDKSYRLRMDNWVFLRTDFELYIKQRTKYKDRIKVTPNPIKPTGSKKTDIINFLSSPSALRPRAVATGEAKTTRVRTEGVYGTW
jgi:hypothetical protein